MSVLGVIPARLESTRLPQKMLLRDTGKPLIQHTWENASKCVALSDLIIATDSDLIEESAISFGANVVRTGKCESGTDRVAAAVKNFAHDIVVNIQGDEPELDPASLQKLIDQMASDEGCNVATLAAPSLGAANRKLDIRSTEIVKVILDHSSNAIYFSRLPIPFAKENCIHSPTFFHIGVYAFRRPFLFEFQNWKRTPLERSEGLEQLRILEYGHRIKVVVVDSFQPGIDTLSDYHAFVKRLGGAT